VLDGFIFGLKNTYGTGNSKAQKKETADYTDVTDLLKK
jgi:hypothetical protein